MPSSTKLKAGSQVRRRATDRIATISGFTTKPSGSGRETRIRLDQITKTYEPVGA